MNEADLPEFLALFPPDIVTLPVDLRGLPETVRFRKWKLHLKDEFHVTLIRAKRIASYMEESADLEDLTQEMFREIRRYTQDHELCLAGYRDEIRFAQEEDKKTLVVMCEVSGLEDLFERLNRVFETGVPLPPTHVTLYTLSNKKAIGLSDPDELEQLTRLVRNDELRQLKAALRFDQVLGNALLERA